MLCFTTSADPQLPISWCAPHPQPWVQNLVSAPQKGRNLAFGCITQVCKIKELQRPWELSLNVPFHRIIKLAKTTEIMKSSHPSPPVTQCHAFLLYFLLCWEVQQQRCTGLCQQQEGEEGEVERKSHHCVCISSSEKEGPIAGALSR